MDRLLHLLSVGEGRLIKEEQLLGDADVAGLSESLTRSAQELLKSAKKLEQHTYLTAAHTHSRWREILHQRMGEYREKHDPGGATRVEVRTISNEVVRSAISRMRCSDRRRSDVQHVSQ
jgi:hypothetical protein